MSTILVIEDSATDQAVISQTLIRDGFAVIVANNEEEGLKQISKQRPDLIVLDVVLPDRSGFEMCRDLKEKAETKDIPVVMCSSKGSNMDKFWGMQQGAEAYLSKPVDETELLKAVHKLL